MSTFVNEDLIYLPDKPESLLAKLNAFSGTTNLGDISTLTTTAKDTAVAAINEINAKSGTDETKLAAKVKIKIVNGAASGDVAMGETIASVVAVIAFVAASGAVATKALLAVTTDYTVGSNKLTMASDQSLNKLLVIYTVA